MGQGVAEKSVRTDARSVSFVRISRQDTEGLNGVDLACLNESLIGATLEGCDSCDEDHSTNVTGIILKNLA
jgi:hypothetical protein